MPGFAEAVGCQITSVPFSGTMIAWKNDYLSQAPLHLGGVFVTNVANKLGAVGSLGVGGVAQLSP